MEPYYSDDAVTLYHGDCREVTEWLAADVLVTDPPYGMDYESRYSGDAVVGDADTSVRDAALAMWGKRPAMVFGSWRNARPACEQVLIWDKGDEASLGHPVFFSAHEEIYVIGTGWKGPRRSNVIRLRGLARGGEIRKSLGHATPKPVSIMETLISHCPLGIIADPFVGVGPVLMAAIRQGRRAIGVELEERHCETAARRLSQGVLEVTA
jgi:site-specific DNA-methyltransferase (adenine-specific)